LVVKNAIAGCPAIEQALSELSTAILIIFEGGRVAPARSKAGDVAQARHGT
jgi:hypothetical protein